MAALPRQTVVKFCRASRIAKVLTIPSRTGFFSRKDPPKPEEIDAEIDRATEQLPRRKYNAEEPSLKYNLSLLKAKGGLDTKRPYKPERDTENQVRDVVSRLCKVDEGNWQEASLQDPLVKYKVVTELIEKFDHEMPSSVLSDVRTAEDVCNYFLTEVRSTTALDDLSKLDLPKNLHIQLDYLRFDPQNDKFFEGRTAFPGNNTHVTSIKYKRKYKDVITKKEKPGYVDHYYGY